jgi:hypothetical protein
VNIENNDYIFYSQMKIQMDDFSKFANDRMTTLANLEAWQETDPRTDDLALDEKLVKITETALSDNHEEDIEEDEDQPSFDIVEDLMSVAAE